MKTPENKIRLDTIIISNGEQNDINTLTGAPSEVLDQIRRSQRSNLIRTAAVRTMVVYKCLYLQCEHFQRITSIKLCPPNRRWGTYCFWCGSRRRRRRRRRPRRRPRPRSFFLTRYLLNQWMDFDQTCIDTWLGGGKELIRFW